AGSDITIPLLLLTRAERARWSLKGRSGNSEFPWRILADDQRLIAFTSPADNALATSLFPEQSPVIVTVDVADVLAGSPQAWQILDALVLDAAGFQTIRPRLAEFLANNTTLIVRTDARPDQNWPWTQQREGYWILAPNLAGPLSAEFNEDPYLPTYSWVPSWPAAFRLHIIFGAVAFSILALLLSLWRSRFAAVALAVLCALAVGRTLLWRNGHAPVMQSGGAVLVQHPGMTQLDHWSYQTSPDKVAGGLPVVQPTWPMLFSRAQAESLKLSLVCDDSGKPIRYVYELPERMRLAFLRREVSTGRPDYRPLPIRSPMRALAEEAYATPGCSIVGERGAQSAEDWPTVILELK
ncbi:MAG TPA: hypothetical protein VIL86_06260, partial [Tepidisphaeraceae bacterium]